MPFRAVCATTPELDCKSNRCLGCAVPAMIFMKKDLI
jgi:hypothetical protein